jgi:hypothetical protein
MILKMQRVGSNDEKCDFEELIFWKLSMNECFVAS